MDPMAHRNHMRMADQHANHGPAPVASAHDQHAGHSVAMFRDKFWLSFALAIPVVFLSGDVQHWLGYTVPSFPGSTLLAPLLGTVIFFYGGLVFIRGARHDDPHQPGDHGCLSYLAGWNFRLVQNRSLVGTRNPDNDYDPRSLAGNARGFPGSWSTQCARRFTPGHGRTRDRRRNSDGASFGLESGRRCPGEARH